MASRRSAVAVSRLKSASDSEASAGSTNPAQWRGGRIPTYPRRYDTDRDGPTGCPSSLRLRSAIRRKNSASRAATSSTLSGAKDDQDWYEACNPALPDARGLVPVSFFQSLGRTERDSGSQPDVSNAPRSVPPSKGPGPDHDSDTAMRHHPLPDGQPTMPKTGSRGRSHGLRRCHV